MTNKHPARGARIATGIATGLALVGMVGGYQAAEAAQFAITKQAADQTIDATVKPAPAAPAEPAPAAAAPAPAPAAPSAPAPAPAAPAPAPAAPEPAPPAPAPVDGSTGGS